MSAASLRWALRAFPRRFRSARAAEIEATFLEAEMAGERNVYGLRAIVDVVLAGWRERLRSRPPFGVYLRYRLLGGRLDPAWRPWVLDDLQGWFRLRRAAAMVTTLALTLTALYLLTGDPPIRHPIVWPIMAIAGWLGATFERTRVLRRHGFGPRARPSTSPND